MSRRSKSIDEAVMKAVRAGNISVMTVHDHVCMCAGSCAQKEVAASLKRMVKQGALEYEKSTRCYKLSSRSTEA